MFKGRQPYASQRNSMKFDSRPPLSPEPSNYITFGLSDGVGDSYPCAKFHYDPIWVFCSPHLPRAAMSTKWLTRLAFTVERGSDDAVQPSHLHRFWRSVSQMTTFRARMCLLGVPKTKFYISAPIFPRTGNLAGWGEFWRDLEISHQNALTWRTSQINTPYSKSYTPLEVGCRICKSSSTNPNMRIVSTPETPLTVTLHMRSGNNHVNRQFQGQIRRQNLKMAISLKLQIRWLQIL